MKLRILYNSFPPYHNSREQQGRTGATYQQQGTTRNCGRTAPRESWRAT